MSGSTHQTDLDLNPGLSIDLLCDLGPVKEAQLLFFLKSNNNLSTTLPPWVVNNKIKMKICVPLC